MAKIRTVIYSDGTKHHLYFCPGCGWEHAFSPIVHQYNDDPNSPTVSPSLLNDNPQHYKVCHSFLNAGKMQFLGDCWHGLKNQTVELPDYPPEEILLRDYTKRQTD